MSRGATLTVVIIISLARAHAVSVVIGAGQGRTGTDSLRIALNTLGAGPTYHMSQLLGIDASRAVGPLEMLGFANGHNDHWIDVEHNASRGLPIDFGFLSDDYRSALDQPAATYFKQLLDARPSAKVILTTRDPVALHRSSRDTWCRLIGAGSAATALDRFAAMVYSLRPYGRRFFRMHDAMGRGTARALGGGWAGFSWRRVCADEVYAVKFFKAWDDHVRGAVPASQLLEFETGKHGYAELAAFLGSGADIAAVPTGTPYPRTNSRQQFGFVLNIMRVLAVLCCVLPCVFLRLVFRKCVRGKREQQQQRKQKST